MDPVFSKERERVFVEALIDSDTTIKIMKDFLILAVEDGALRHHLMKLLLNSSQKTAEILASPRPVTMDS